MKNTTLGIIIAGSGKPNRWITRIKDYERMEDGKAYVTDTDNTNHIFDINDIVWFDPADAIQTLAAKYYQVPNSCLTYAAAFG